MFIPVNALGKYSLEGVHTGTFYDIDKCARVEDDLYAGRVESTLRFGKKVGFGTRTIVKFDSTGAA